MANTIKIKRGLSSNIDNTTLAQGELAITTDTNELYVGTDSGNKKVGSGPKNLLDGNIAGSVRTSGSAEESNSYKLGQNAFAEGGNTKASGWGSHAEGGSTTASGSNSHAEGIETTASELGSHAEGIKTTASGWYSHAEGNQTTASGFASHAEGNQTTASGEASHAEGFWAKAREKGSHAEGYYATASGTYSHAEGKVTTASGEGSHAEGCYTTASGSNSHAQGKYNIEDTENKYAHIVGNGTDEYTKRSNAHTLDWQGNAWFAGDVYTGSTSGTNKDDGSKVLATKEYVTDSIGNIQETINIQKDSSITDTGIGKLDVASANIFTATTEPHFYKVGVADTTLYNGILYNGTIPFRNVTDNSLVRIQKDAVIYYAGGVAYCFTGEGIYSLLWDDTEKKGWVTKVKMDNESYYISYLQDSLPNVTVTAGDFTWDATERTLTATGAASTTKTATIKFNEDVSGFYFSLSNTSGTGRYGILSAKVNNEDYYIGHMQGLGTDCGQWDMKKDDVLTVKYEGDLTSTADETFVFKIMHWQKAAETSSAGSYANYVDGMSQLSEQITTSRIQTDISNLQYDVRNISIPTKVSQLNNDSGYITDYSLKYIHDDGTNLFGWGATATDGTDMTSEHGMQADEVAGVYIGATYEWNSRLSFSTVNYGMVTYCTMDKGTADDGTKYNIVHIVMNGSEYDYVYSSSQNKVYKGIAWGGESGGLACFTGDTPILTTDGLKPIKEVKIGDRVLTVNTMKTAVVERPITKLVSHEETEIYKLYVNDEIIETTASHPFVTKEKGRCNARILEKGMTLIDMNGNSHTIDNIEIASTNTIVYEIVVDETRNYFVGNSNIQVYNEPSSYLEKKEA